MKNIHVARDFSETPGGRFRHLGPKSGEEFRDILVKELTENSEVTVILDDVEGYGSSFLEEAFGGLVRLGRWSANEIMRRLHIIAIKPTYKTYEREARGYIADAADPIRG